MIVANSLRGKRVVPHCGTKELSPALQRWEKGPVGTAEPTLPRLGRLCLCRERTYTPGDGRSTVKEHYALAENARKGAMTINGRQSGKMSGHSALTTDLWLLTTTPNFMRLKYLHVNVWGSITYREFFAKALILREGWVEFCRPGVSHADVLCCLADRDSHGRAL